LNGASELQIWTLNNDVQIVKFSSYVCLFLQSVIKVTLISSQWLSPY